MILKPTQKIIKLIEQLLYDFVVTCYPFTSIEEYIDNAENNACRREYLFLINKFLGEA